MPRRRIPAATAMNPFSLWTDLALKTGEMLAASAQVITHRTSRMVSAGTSPNARDRKEFRRMGLEKVEAAGESAWAMAEQMGRTQLDLGLKAWQDMAQAGAAWMSVASSRSLPQALAKQTHLVNTVTRSVKSAQRLSDATARVTSRGLKPVHTKATANAKRLGKLKRS
jgi:hypothetical protein